MPASPFDAGRAPPGRQILGIRDGEVGGLTTIGTELIQAAKLSNWRGPPHIIWHSPAAIASTNLHWWKLSQPWCWLRHYLQTLAWQGMVAPDRALRPRQHNRHSGDMPDRPAALDALIRDAEAAAADQTDPLAVLVMLIQIGIRSDADPYLLNGALIEGIAMTIMQRIPAERREEVSREAMRVLYDRLHAKGTI